MWGFYLFDSFVRTKCSHSASLNLDVTLSQQFQRFESVPIGAHQSLSTLHESLLIPCHIPNLYDVGRHVVLNNPLGLLKWDTPCQQLDHVSCLDNHVGIPRFSCRLHRHTPLYQVEKGVDSVLFQAAHNIRPNLGRLQLEQCSH